MGLDKIVKFNIYDFLISKYESCKFYKFLICLSNNYTFPTLDSNLPF